MSGISGIFYYNKNHKASDIRTKSMLEAIKHRGPDGQYYYTKNNLSIGFCDKSIKKKSFKTDRIFTNSNKDIYLACDGLIYNSKELRRELIKEGCQFSSESDIEVIIHLYEKEGIKFCQELEGNFAFALWDEKKEQLILGRDHLGVKPLYYFTNSKGIIFGSEIKSILAYPGFRRVINFEALSHYFFDRIIPSPTTAFSGINSVNPGTIVIIRESKISEKKYWQMGFKEEYDLSDVRVLSGLVREQIESSVRHRLDFFSSPAIALSGGIDSSILLSIAKKYSDKPIKTFYIKYPKESLNKKIELGRVKQIVKIFKTDHANYELKPDDYLEQLGENIKALDNPVSMYSNYYFISKAAKEIHGADIFLEGDGSEELFSGYWYHFFSKMLENKNYSEYLKGLDKDSFLAKKKNKYDIAQLLFVIKNYDWRFGRPLVPVFTSKTADSFFSPNILKKLRITNLHAYSTEILKMSTAREFMNKVLDLDIRTFFPNHTLQVIDRLSMANSVVACSPFVNWKLLDLSGKIYTDLKIYKDGTAKFILREAMKGLIPKELLFSKFKEGGGVPIREWLLLDYEKFVRNVLSRRRIERHLFFKPEFISNLLKEHYSNKNYSWDKKGYGMKLQKDGIDHTIKIWNLVIFQLWWEKYFN